MSSTVDILMAVHNGAEWLGDVLDAAADQDFPGERISFTVFDNASSDDSVRIVREHLDGRRLTVIPSSENIGFWAAIERMASSSRADHILALTDVVLGRSYVSSCVAALERDDGLGAVQGKLLQKGDPGIIDGCGFNVERSRRVTILGHGQYDDGRWASQRYIFGVEGAAPMYRRAAWESCRIGGKVVDPDFRVGPLGYGDDLDIAWRMSLFGWRQALVPGARGRHDRSTTKSVGTSVAEHVARRRVRGAIEVSKRRLDWSNVRFSIIKNDRMIDFLRDLPWIAARETAVQGYFLLFEPAVLLEWGRFLRLLPRMLRRRRAVQAHARRASLRRLFSTP